MSTSPETNYAINITGAILRGHDFDDAVEMMLELDQELSLIPARSRADIVAAADHLRDRAGAIGYVTTRKVIDNAAALIAAAAAVDKSRVSQFNTPDQAAKIHLYRNLLLAAVLAASRSTLANKSEAEQLASEIPSLRQRTAGLTRSYTDDETLLLRMWALTLSQVGGADGRRAACVYAQCDAGLYPSETPKILRQSLDLTPGNGLIEAPGMDHGVTSRILELDEFNIRVIAEYMDLTDDAPHERLTYRPRTEEFNSKRASSSVSGILDRQRAAVGLAHGDTTVSSITMWRAVHTQLTSGMSAAVEVCGRPDADSYLRFTRTRRNPQRTRGGTSRPLVPLNRC
ncbi:hypothetical protein [Aeromicrobium chenweiae]|uniref:Uncharacterized protein n=1 Tax=Aeromicrobium chenweiae TaxID=2079793 RepID=A0A2S0WIU1_9ACTN|nr:hypothetical protein [Aeromicrobium chenweiae]AWB91150.1 hypothetical protein C3E78_02330 [Aeromicrobium chenweiae]TGN31670.1 hypothetical protein E4L97_11845 [Aeromicrobium chenweiae]